MLRVLLCLMSVLVATKSADAGVWAAIQQDSPALIRRELKKDPSLLNTPGSGGQTPIMHAVLSGKVEALKTLIELGADASIGEKDGYTPFHGAGFQGRAEMVPLLLAYGLDPNDMHRDGYTPIHRACWGRESRHAETVAAFIEAGVDPKQPSRDGRTPLAMTQNAQTRDILRAALARGDL